LQGVSPEYEWLKEAACKEYLQSWVTEKKLTQRVEELKPGEWFRAQWSEWCGLVSAWKKKQSEHRDPNKRAQVQKRKREAEAPKKDGDGEAEGEAEVKEEQEEEEEKEEEPKPKVDANDLDPFAVEDVCDIGSGEPLFANFEREDWMLLSLRFELHLLVHAFRRDLNDAERPQFHERHLPFYYQRYYKKGLLAKSFGKEKLTDVVDLVQDTVEMCPKNSMLARVPAA